MKERKYGKKLKVVQIGWGFCALLLGGQLFGRLPRPCVGVRAGGCPSMGFFPLLFAWPLVTQWFPALSILKTVPFLRGKSVNDVTISLTMSYDLIQP